MAKEKGLPGIVIEALGNAKFRVEMDDDSKEVICYLAGKMRQRCINVCVGDKVEVILDPMGGHATNRIIWRR